MSSSFVSSPWRVRTPARYAVIESLAAAIACAASIVLPMSPLALVTAWLFGWTVALGLLILWVLSGLLVAMPSVSEGIVSWLCGFREPTRTELARLASAWDDVCRGAAVAPTAFALRVIPCPPPEPLRRPDINAAAAGTNVVAVSQDALALLDDGQLCAILAHELGHHVGYDAVPRAIIAWYLTLSEKLLGRRFGGFLATVYLPITLILSLASRPAEFAADEFAARLGHGRELARMLSSLGPSRPGSFAGAILASHPATVDRIRRLEGA
jgi:Zn-dependent protease with chaperone function